MRRILIAILDVVIWIAIIASTAGGAFLGGRYYPMTYRQSAEIDWGLALTGGFLAFVLAMAVFGGLAVLIQIEANTRRSGDVFTALVRRAEARLDRDA
jgi:uncharacterized membrane protein